MLVKEYDAMMAAKGTPRVWCVTYAISCPGFTHSKLFATESEAREFASRTKHLVSCGEVWDIWNWTARNSRK